ncbi:MAG: hypothetical protein ACKOLA_13300 [Spartobacteria bacterium]
MAMIAPNSSKPAFSRTDQGNDSENAVFVFVKASEFYPMSSNSGFLEFKNFLKDWFFPGIQAERASCLPANYLPSQASRPRYIPEAQKRSDFWHQNLRGEKAGRREKFITQRKGQARKP